MVVDEAADVSLPEAVLIDDMLMKDDDRDLPVPAATRNGQNSWSAAEDSTEQFDEHPEEELRGSGPEVGATVGADVGAVVGAPVGAPVGLGVVWGAASRTMAVRLCTVPFLTPSRS